MAARTFLVELAGPVNSSICHWVDGVRSCMSDLPVVGVVEMWSFWTRSLLDCSLVARDLRLPAAWLNFAWRLNLWCGIPSKEESSPLDTDRRVLETSRKPTAPEVMGCLATGCCNVLCRMQKAESNVSEFIRVKESGNAGGLL